MAGLLSNAAASGHGSIESLEAAVLKHGPAPGAKKMMQWEREAAEAAVASGNYLVYRSQTASVTDCSRVGPHSRCFCGHELSLHGQKLGPCGSKCTCKRFEYVPLILQTNFKTT